MLIPTHDQLDADIDYFATDPNGHILHLASGGGVLPGSVAASHTDLLALHQHFLTRPETGAAQLAEGVDTAEASGAARYVPLLTASYLSFTIPATPKHLRQQYLTYCSGASSGKR
ncbi:hypothetical protein [Hymenobacter rubripertinctus]|uniref:Uncharacterized protein n=1 Tax=Hymenobacter rubripertinctus TaxID=2029981 RepID=A0A418QUJ1_9BACT|nr:hypothetical protein [Hymenobacter rubripertinctus]RIY08761.1 hypothetical protein D0T11_13575 [Hymenobacter rubripertinctus]